MIAADVKSVIIISVHPSVGFRAGGKADKRVLSAPSVTKSPRGQLGAMGRGEGKGGSGHVTIPLVESVFFLGGGLMSDSKSGVVGRCSAHKSSFMCIWAMLEQNVHPRTHTV